MNEMYAPFLKRIRSLRPADRAALKRATGRSLSEADGKALSAFYRCLPFDVSKGLEDRWFTVACLTCYCGIQKEPGFPLEKVIARMMASGELSDSTQHRIESLLDTAWAADGYAQTKMVRIVKMIYQKSGNIPIDFSSLLDDLIYWNASNQSVQRKWARAIFGDTFESKEEEKEENIIEKVSEKE